MRKPQNYPKGLKDNLPAHAQEIYLAAFNNAYEEYDRDEDRARRRCLGRRKERWLRQGRGHR
jgi:cation transport regulator